jgi:ribosome-associated protein
MLYITRTISIYNTELEYQFIGSSGPGGQNVNKVATAVQLRFDAGHSPSLPEEVRSRLQAIAGRRLSANGMLLIKAQRYRSQDRNRADATERLVTLLQSAAVAPRQRHATNPTRASQKRRLETKTQKGRKKQLRGPVGREEQ